MEKTVKTCSFTRNDWYGWAGASPLQVEPLIKVWMENGIEVTAIVSYEGAEVWFTGEEGNGSYLGTNSDNYGRVLREKLGRIPDLYKFDQALFKVNSLDSLVKLLKKFGLKDGMNWKGSLWEKDPEEVKAMWKEADKKLNN